MLEQKEALRQLIIERLIRKRMWAASIPNISYLDYPNTWLARAQYMKRSKNLCETVG